MTDLATIGELATILSPDDLVASLNRAVELLLQATGADDCELFLAEPGGGDALLTACRGLDRDALIARDRFPRGQGYPGLAVSRGQTLLTHALVAGRRLPADSAESVSIKTYLCVPVPGPAGAIGCIGVAWRSAEVNVEPAAELLPRVAEVIATAVRAGLAGARERLQLVLESAAGSSAAERRAAFLDAVVRASGAPSATLILFSHPSDEPMVLSTSRAEVRPQEVCQCAVRDGRLRCRILEAGHAAALGTRRDDWPEHCKRLPAAFVAPYCLPLLEGRQLQGVLLLDYKGAPPDPITGNVVQLMAMISDTAARLEPPIALPPAHPRAEASPELRLRCFGKLEIRLGDEVVADECFARKKALTLLKLLVLRRGNPVSRDALIEHLWPGVDDKAGSNRLHGVVHALRCGIEPFRDKKRWLFVRNQGDLYYFDTESPHWVDVFAFRRLAASARDLERGGNPEQAIGRLEEAAALYRGNLFEDEPYADWCALERDELRSTYLDVVRDVARLCGQTGNPDRAAAHLRRGLLVDRLREDLHQMLIETLIGLGRRRDALAQYRECARLLREEIGAEPLPATRRLERLATADAGPV